MARLIRTAHLMLWCLVIVVSACAIEHERPQSPPLEIRSASTDITPDPNQPIRLVDFNNFSFPWVADLGNPKQHFQLQHGEFAGGKTEVPLSLRSIAYGDVTGDKVEEATIVLSVTVEGGTARPHVVYVYALENGRPKLLQAFMTGDRGDGGLRRAYFERGEFVVELYGKNRLMGKDSTNDEDQLAVCCPRFFTRARYTWQGNAFQQQGVEEVLPNPSGRAALLTEPQVPSEQK